jgi:hypothetical protein
MSTITTLSPEAALAELRTEDRWAQYRLDAGEALAAWIRNGGYAPQGLFPKGHSYIGHTAAKLAALRLLDAELDALCDIQEAEERRWGAASVRPTRDVRCAR